MSQPLDPEVEVEFPQDPITEPEVEVSEEQDSAVSESGLPPVESGVQSPFDTIPELRDASLDEIANLYRMQRNTIVSQTQELNRRHEESQLPPVSEPIPADEYYTDPDAATRRIISEELARTTAPIAKDFAEMRESRIFDEMRSQYGDFGDLEPYIREAVRGHEVSKGNLMTAYLSVRGARGLGIVPGLDAGPSQEQPKTQSKVPLSVPPHQRPGSPPPAKPKVTKRPLNEEERLMARNMKLTEDEFRDLGKEDVFEVGSVEGGER